MKNLFIVLLTCMSLNAFAGDWFLNSDLDPHVRLAHENYLKNDRLEMVKEVKEGLMANQHRHYTKKNLLDLVSAAYSESKDSQLPSDWKFPQGLEYLLVEVRRLSDPNFSPSGHRIIIAGNTQLPENIEQFQIIKYPSEVLIDKAAGIGEFKFEKWANGENGFWGSSKSSSHHVERGLYLLNIKLAGGTMTNGWFVITDENASDSPQVTYPTYEQTYKTGQPYFKWLPFHSPEYKPNERVVVKTKISRNEPPDNPKEFDGTFITNDITEFTFGDHSKFKDFTGPDSLKEGKYFFQIHYSERKKFGDLVLSRASTTRIPFTIK